MATWTTFVWRASFHCAPRRHSVHAIRRSGPIPRWWSVVDLVASGIRNASPRASCGKSQRKRSLFSELRSRAQPETGIYWTRVVPTALRGIADHVVGPVGRSPFPAVIDPRTLSSLPQIADGFCMVKVTYLYSFVLAAKCRPSQFFVFFASGDAGDLVTPVKRVAETQHEHSCRMAASTRESRPARIFEVRIEGCPFFRWHTGRPPRSPASGKESSR